MDSAIIKGIISKQVSSKELEKLVGTRWRCEEISDQVDLTDMPCTADYSDIPWTKVDCMQTKLIDKTGDGIGFGLDLFAPSSEEKSFMHIHPRGDRVATVLEGHGTFFALRENGKLIRKEMSPGDVVFFPRGTPHAFWGTETESLLIHVALNPFVEFNDPEHTVPSVAGAQALKDEGLL